MSKKPHAKFIKQMLRNSLFYTLKAGFKTKDGHLPKSNHQVPNDFIGVCVASNADVATDDYIIGQLETLGMTNVRLDFSYDDLDHFNERFLQRLIAGAFNITLHLITPYDAVQNMADPAEQDTWQAFLTTVLDRYGAAVKQVEIGSTINRRRWAGYTYDTFMIAWEIAHKAVVIEPERFDHRMFWPRVSTAFKYNLVKKARILQKIGQDFNVKETTSPAAFWAIYRIKRYLVAGEQKQADYLTRYFTLLASSNALTQANWGALICNREGLINDGLVDAEYPPLERITHYKSADGMLNAYERYPSFYAMQTIQHYLNGADYQSAIASTNGLEIHHLHNHGQQFHIAWTVNGKAAYLADIYSKETLNNAKILHRDGNALENNTDLICETPIYLIWDTAFHIDILPTPALAKDLSLHSHIDDVSYFRFKQDGWSGLVLANNADEAELLIKALHPDTLSEPKKSESLRHARNAVWAIEDPRNNANEITVKKPIRMYPHKVLFDRCKPSKAKRSWNGTMELLRRDIGAAQPVAFFEKDDDPTLKQNFYICERVKADCSIGQIFSAFTKGETSHLELTRDQVFKQFAQFTHKMHSRGVYFRDYSGGNILVSIKPDEQLAFSLIDTARIRSFNTGISLKLRIADLTRACHKLTPKDRSQFMQTYLALSGRKFSLAIQSKFWLYDFKVKLKRTIGRKGIKKLKARLKGR